MGGGTVKETVPVPLPLHLLHLGRNLRRDARFGRREQGFRLGDRLGIGINRHLGTLLAPLLMVGITGTCGNKTANNDVFLEAAQTVLHAAHRGFREHAGSLLEGSRGDKRLGGE